MIFAGLTLFAPITTYAASLTSEASVTIQAPLRIENISSLNFGTIAPDTIVSGSVKVHADSDNSATCDGAVDCIEGGYRAKFTLAGLAGQSVSIGLPMSITMSNGVGDLIEVNQFEYDAPNMSSGNILLGANGTADLGVGATLDVQANQAVGTYTGTFVVTASYE